jgi:hypothetical protein
MMDTERVQQFLADLRLLDEDRFELVDRLRKIVLTSHPKITEEVKYGGLLYSAGAPFCGIFSYTAHVSLEFSRGAELPDPHHVLEGEGKQRRHIKLTGRPDLFKKNVKEYVTLACQATAVSLAKRGARSAPR